MYREWDALETKGPRLGNRQHIPHWCVFRREDETYIVEKGWYEREEEASSEEKAKARMLLVFGVHRARAHKYMRARKDTPELATLLHASERKLNPQPPPYRGEHCARGPALGG